MKTASYWEPRGDKVQCLLCPHACLLADGRTGRCGVRQAQGNKLAALGYGIVSSANLDPAEKKPLYHFHPGSLLFSIGGWGCNLSCSFCQNWTISQEAGLGGHAVAPAEIVRKVTEVARREREGDARTVGIAYTYNEPLIGIEFVRDCAEEARAHGLKNVLVTNGYVQARPAADLLPWMDALNVDIKSMEESFYREMCGGSLAPVLAFTRQARAAGCHVEVTNLLIPGLNDTASGVETLAKWVLENLGGATPLHLSAYHPDYKLQIPPTPGRTLERALEVCRKHLSYVYVGNVVSGDGQDTKCPGCGALLVRRRGYTVRIEKLAGGRCAACGRPAEIVTDGA